MWFRAADKYVKLGTYYMNWFFKLDKKYTEKNNMGEKAVLCYSSQKHADQLLQQKARYFTTRFSSIGLLL
jgi:hypothetical protein